MFKKKSEPIRDECTKIIKEFESIRSYKRSMGFEEDWSTFIDFVEDRQWTTTEKNKNIPNVSLMKVS